MYSSFDICTLLMDTFCPLRTLHEHKRTARAEFHDTCACTRTMIMRNGGSIAVLAKDEFGNKNGYTPTSSDTGENYM